MKRLYEPITADQIKKIHATAKEYGIPYERVYSMIEKLISIPSMSSLSQQEAVHIIEKLLGDEKWRRPPRARTEKDIPGAGANRPTMDQIHAIRNTVKALGWDRDHFKAWLKKYRHVASLREHDRDQARGTYVALKAIQKRALKKAATTEEENGHVIH